jgi:hypothetical protein
VREAVDIGRICASADYHRTKEMLDVTTACSALPLHSPVANFAPTVAPGPSPFRGNQDCSAG